DRYKNISLYIDVDNDIKPIADECLELGAKVVMLKCGAPGIYYRTGNKTQITEISDNLGFDLDGWNNREGFEKSYIPDRVLSGTGAGDTTIAAFLAAVMKGYTFDMCIHLAAAEGASCITEYDALSGVRSLDDLCERIGNGWAKRDSRTQN
ncbi:MAG: carbohydrate kinase family protein, partial [Lachnospiraceae bacterium]